MDINKNVGFFYQCYKQTSATETVLNKVRIYFPNNPIYLICDDGYDMSYIAKKYNCKYVHSFRNLCKEAKTKNLTNLSCNVTFEWLNRLLDGIKWCNTEYIINLEDDVICYNNITSLPIGDINGVYDCKWAPNTFSVEFLKYLTNKNIIPKYKYYGACGGFIMNANKFKTVMENTNIELLENLNKLDNRIGSTSDCTITALFLINNFTYYPWDDLKSKWDDRTITTYAFYHPDKSYYT
jgi:hypothetical protein